MARAERASNERASKVHQPKGYAKRISDHIALALVVYTLMLIFMVTPNLASGTHLWPYFLLVLLVAAVIPFFRMLDHKWQTLEKSELGHGGLDTRFAMDRIKLWTVAIGLPLLLTLFCRSFAFAG
jgi:hypothetical protein